MISIQDGLALHFSVVPSRFNVWRDYQQRAKEQAAVDALHGRLQLISDIRRAIEAGESGLPPALAHREHRVQPLCDRVRRRAAVGRGRRDCDQGKEEGDEGEAEDGGNVGRAKASRCDVRRFSSCNLVLYNCPSARTSSSMLANWSSKRRWVAASVSA